VIQSNLKSGMTVGQLGLTVIILANLLITIIKAVVNIFNLMANMLIVQ
jgi:hypothetical protein